MDIRRRLIERIARAKSATALLAWFVVVAVAQSNVAVAGDFSRGLLWRIDSAGAEPSYLFGTIHSEDERVLALAPPVRQAFDEARRVCLEIKLDANALVTTSLAMMLTDGRTLEDIVGAELFRKTADALAERAVPEMVATRLKPWAAATTLSVPAPETGQVLDTALYQQGVAAGKPVEGLETVEEQVQVFEDIDEQQQIALLRDTVEHLSEAREEYDAMVDAWLDRNLAALVAEGEKSLGRTDSDFAKDFERTLIVERNQRMDERMQPYLKTGGAFIAVGALHLAGENGLLRLLERRGYRITRVW